MNQRIAVIVPCYNEGKTLQAVITQFKHALPEAVVYVYDNHSTDNSVAVAKAAGAVVRHVSLRGKGQVVRRMFADVDADCYVMVDGDATYDANAAPKAIQLLNEHHLDMVVCTREPVAAGSFRPGHALGNKWFTKAVNRLFGHQFNDIFSGYRIFSKRFVKSFPAISQGFEIETEITVHALQLSLPTAEMATPYQERPPGSHSKLNTIGDGIRISRTILLLFFYTRPMALFGSICLLLAAISLGLGIPIILAFLKTGLVLRIPTALLAASLGVLASLSLACGMILASISRSRLENKRCWYLMANAK